MEEKQA